MRNNKKAGSRIKVSRKYCPYCRETFVLVFDEENVDVKELTKWVDFVNKHRTFCAEYFGYKYGHITKKFKRMG